MNRAVAVAALIGLCGGACLESWSTSGLYRCSSDGTCPVGLCDDGVCCDPLGDPPCPTLPSPNGLCRDGDAGVPFFEDRDSDGFGNQKLARRMCALPRAGGWSASDRDCDDANAAISPSAAEQCNGRDDNCNGQLDEGLTPRTTWLKDEDGDGSGADAVTVEACLAPPGYVAVGGDCAPFDPARHPGASELCNGVDDDCDLSVDEPPLADVQNVGDVTLRYPCFAASPGVCREGEFRCQAGQRACASRRVPVVEICDRLDNNCDGRVDEQPACGGPLSFVATPGVTYGAYRVGTTSTLTSRCQKGVAGNTAQIAQADGTWSGTTTGYHGWYIEAPANAVWDLSAPDVKLNLHFTATFTAVGGDGAWGNPDAGAGYNPVVYLCGDDDSQVMRYRITTMSSAFALNETAFDGVLQLNVQNPGNTWIVGIGSGFDTSRVRRIELLMQSFTPAFTVTFAPTTGLSR